MSTDVADQLRSLARDRAAGLLTLAAYRRLRAPLLDALVGIVESPSPLTTQPRAAMQRGEPPATSRDAAPTEPPEARGPETDAARAQPPEGRDPKTIVSIVAVGVLLASLLGFIVWRHASSRHTEGSATLAAGGQSGPGEDADPVHALLQPLLDSPDWSDSRLLALNDALLEAGHTRIAADQDAEWFNTFVERVRTRLKEQQALAAAPLTPDRSPLAALAATLGIDVASPAAAQPVHAGAPGPAGASTSSEHAAQQHDAQQHEPQQQHEVRRSSAVHPDVVASDAVQRASATDPSRAAAPGTAIPVGTSAPSNGGASSRHAEVSAVRESGAASASRSHPACSAALVHERRNYCADLLSSGEVGPLLAVVPAGSFMMGDADVSIERPVHRVSIPRPFAMSVHEISQAEYLLYCRSARKSCPTQPWTGDYPVVEVSWDDARSYVEWLSHATAQIYRLPSEAEWEYAARAGQTGLYPSGTTLSQTDAYFSTASTLSAPAPGGQAFNANAWHLLHMIGNVREWVLDDWNPTFAGAPSDGGAWIGDSGTKVVRGGSYADPAIRLRLTTREPLSAGTRDRLTGIRVVREIR